MNPPAAYRTIKQPEGSKLCGACVVAMAVDTSLDDVRNTMVPSHTEEGDEWYDIPSILGYLGGCGIFCGLTFKELEGGYFKLVSTTDLMTSMTLDDHPALLGVKSDTFPGYDHWVFWDGKVVRDPKPGVPDETDLGDYEICEVVPLTYISD